MESLLDFSKPLDINLLDQAVHAFYIEGNPQVGGFVTAFQNHPESWTRVDGILERSAKLESKVLACNILQKAVQTKWNILPPEQRNGIKTFVVNLIIKLSAEPALLAANKLLLTKLNMVLVAIVKHEWPSHWPNFIPELVNSSRTSQSLCANNMNILLLLSEEVFDFSNGQMTQDKMKEMKKNLNREFTLIFQLCDYVLDHSTDPALLTATLQTLLRFLHWIPIGYIFETKLISTLCLKFFPVAQFQNDTLVCLSEIGGLKLKEDIAPGVMPTPAQVAAAAESSKYNSSFINLFLAVMSQVCKLITPDTDIASVYATGNDSAQTFIRHLAIFITSFLKAHITLVENESDATRAALGQTISILLRISRVDDTDIFKIVLEYWNVLVTDLYNTQRQFIAQHAGRLGGAGGLLVGATPGLTPMGSTLNSGLTSGTNAPRLAMYLKSLAELRFVMIGKMAKPEEVLIVEDENGEIIRAPSKDTDAITLYKSMRECLIYLTHLDPQDAQDSMLRKLDRQVDTGPTSEWSWNNLNTLCWAIGSVSGALSETAEKTFLVRVIKDLLNLCEQKKGKDHKAVIASNIMYVVGQYPRFLRQHWKFLKTVVKKLFEFMHELHPGVQDMSVDTFLKIAKKCVAAGTSITMADGTAARIEEVATDARVFARDRDERSGETGLGARAVTAVLSQGPKECVELLFLDGRTLVCTGDHPLLTTHGRWEQAADLTLGSSEVSVGLEHPLVALDEDEANCAAWTLDTEASLGFSLDMKQQRAAAMAFVRLMGAAGRVDAATSLSLQHQMDVDACVADVRLLTGVTPAVAHRDGCFDVTLPRPLQRAFAELTVASSVPAFLLSPACPLPLVREYTAGLFGSAAGSSVELEGERFSGVSLSWSLDGATAAVHAAQSRSQLYPLLSRLGVPVDQCSLVFCDAAAECASAAVPEHALVASSSYVVRLSLPSSLSLTFARSIGFRYSCQKQLRLTGAAACERAVECVSEQRAQVATRATELLSSMDLEQAVQQAQSELALRCTMHPLASEWNPSDAAQLASPRASESSLSVPTLLRALDLSQLWSGAASKSSVLPLFRVALVARRAVGVRSVYDLTVPSRLGVSYASYVAHGLTVHNCRKKFVTVQPPENRPFIDEILEEMQTTIKHLEVSQIHVFYSAVGEIIQVEADPNKRQNLVFKLMELPNQTWAQLIAEANHDAQTLFNPVTVKRFILVLKTNNRVAGSLGPGYIVQLARIYVDMLQVYKMYSGYVSMRISEGGAIVTRTAVIRSMRTVKKETLNLIRTFVTQSVDMDREVILNNFIPALLDPVLQDYSRNVPDARDAEVLLLFAEVISKLGVSLIEPGHIQRIFESTFQATLDMITQNFEDHPDHRINFFKLIEAINRHAFPAMLRLNAKQFQLVIDSIIWAVKHLERNIADTGLQILYDLIDNVRMGEFANDFFKTYFISLLQDILGVLTDTLHKPGFRLQSLILAKLFSILETGTITVPLWVNASNPNPGAYPNNVVYVRQFVCALLLKAFPNLSPAQVDQFVLGLFTTQADVNNFKTHLRDFLVQLKEFSATSTDDLYLEERAKLDAARKAEETKTFEAVPGLQYQAPVRAVEAVVDDDANL